jgi:hypothetical protein
VASEYLPAHGVEFAGGRARSDGLHHGLAGLGDNTTGTKECIEILLRVDRHAGILRRTVAPRADGEQEHPEISAIQSPNPSGWLECHAHAEATISSNPCCGFQSSNLRARSPSEYNATGSPDLRGASS